MINVFRLLCMAVFGASSLVAAHICDGTPNQTVVKLWWGLASALSGLISVGFLLCLVFADDQTEKPVNRYCPPRLPPMPEVPPPPPCRKHEPVDVIERRG